MYTLIDRFKLMIAEHSLSNPMWLHRAALWNLVALQSPSGRWSPSDELAAVLRAPGSSTTKRITKTSPITYDDTNTNIKSGAAAATAISTSAKGATRHTHRGDMIVVEETTTRFEAEALRECCPASLRAAAEAATAGQVDADDVWATLLAMAAYARVGHRWIVNPWEPRFAEYEIIDHGWEYVSGCARDDVGLAQAILDADVEAQGKAAEWHEAFISTLTEERVRRNELSLSRRTTTTHVLRNRDRGGRSSWGGCALRVRRWGWVLLRRYLAAHTFFRAFLAKCTDAFDPAEQVMTQVRCASVRLHHTRVFDAALLNNFFLKESALRV